jgi:hypothetical protein
MHRSIRVIAAMLVALGLFTLPTSAFAQAKIERFSVMFPVGPEPIDDTCAGRASLAS